MGDLPAGPVTLLFTDIEGSTQLVHHLGERYIPVLTAHRDIIRAAMSARGGHEVDTQGDSFFFVFPLARDAVAAAIAAQRTLAAHAWPEDGIVRVRMGLHTGEPLRTGEGYIGLDVHRAARIGDAGHGGQVLLSRATADLVRFDLPEGTRLLDMGDRRMRGIPQPERLYQLAISGLPESFPPLKTVESRPNNLPARAGPLVGRDAELAALRERLSRPDTGVVTLIGPGGAGKTALALRAGAELLDAFAHGVFFIRLAPVTERDLLVATVAEALGVRESDTRPLLERLKDFLRERQTLLILDNFEQLLGAAAIVDELLVSCPRLRVLVTSRSALHLRRERLFPVPPLAAPEPGTLPPLDTLATYPAVELLLRRARVARPDFGLTPDSAPLVAQLCRRVEGLPLAIELAAARMRGLPLRTLVARLERRLDAPQTAPDTPPGQRTMRGAIAWSYGLLDPAEQMLCRRLALFAGGCTAAMAATVTSVGGDVEVDIGQGILSLAEKRLLRVEEQPSGEPRYVLPATIREYAMERLVLSGEAAAVRRQFVAYFLALAEEAERDLRSDEPARWPERLRQEHDNLRAALAWSHREGEGSAAIALRLAAALEPYWRMRGYLSEGRGWLDEALTMPISPRAADIRARAHALTAAGSLAQQQKDYTAARGRLEEAVALWRTVADARGLAEALQTLAVTANDQCDFPAAAAGAAAARGAGDAWTEAAALYELGYALLGAQDLPAARARLEESLALYRELEDTWGMARPLLFLGVVLVLLGDLAAARGLLEESLSLAREAEDEPMVALACGYLARLAWRERDWRRMTANGEEWLALARRLGDREGAARALLVLGVAAGGRGDEERARARFTESLHWCRILESHLTAAGALAGLAGMVWPDQPDTAARLAAAARAMLDAVPAALSPSDRIDRARIAELVEGGPPPGIPPPAGAGPPSFEEVLSMAAPAAVTTPGALAGARSDDR